MEVSFRKEIANLKLGAGSTFYGEGILAVTKALLQSGVGYVGGYQGAPVSHLLDVLLLQPYLSSLLLFANNLYGLIRNLVSAKYYHSSHLDSARDD